MVSGVIEPIGGESKLFFFENRKAVPQEGVPAPEHGELSVRLRKAVPGCFEKWC